MKDVMELQEKLKSELQQVLNQFLFEVYDDRFRSEATKSIYKVVEKIENVDNISVDFHWNEKYNDLKVSVMFDLLNDNKINRIKIRVGDNIAGVAQG